MKKGTLLALILLCMLPVFSQNLAGGFKVALNASQIDGDLASGFYKAGLRAGGFVNYAIGRNSAVQVEVLYDQLGSGEKNAGILVKANYVSVPILFNVNIPLDLGTSTQEVKIFAGPVIGVLLSAKNQSNQELTWLRSQDVRAEAGVGYQMGNTIASLRYGYSIVSLAPSNVGSNIIQPGANGMFHNYVSLGLAFILFTPN